MTASYHSRERLSAHVAALGPQVVRTTTERHSRMSENADTCCSSRTGTQRVQQMVTVVTVTGVAYCD